MCFLAIRAMYTIPQLVYRGTDIVGQDTHSPPFPLPLPLSFSRRLIPPPPLPTPHPFFTHLTYTHNIRNYYTHHTYVRRTHVKNTLQHSQLLLREEQNLYLKEQELFRQRRVALERPGVLAAATAISERNREAFRQERAEKGRRREEARRIQK